MIRRIVISVLFLLVLVPEASAQMRHGVQGGYKFGGLPDFVLGEYFNDFKPIFAHGASFEYVLGHPHRHWSFGLFYSALAVADGYWRINDSLPEEGVYAEFPLHFLGLSAAHTWRFQVWRKFFVSPTVGVGLLGILGDVYATELVPGCPGPTQQCGHWKEVTRKPVAMTRIMPLFLLSAGLEYEIDRNTQVSLDLGIANLPFVGISFRRYLTDF